MVFHVNGDTAPRRRLNRLFVLALAATMMSATRVSVVMATTAADPEKAY